MPGTIRFMLGLLITFGAVGSLEDPTTSLLYILPAAAVGLALMYWATQAFNDRRTENHLQGGPASGVRRSR